MHARGSVLAAAVAAAAAAASGGIPLTQPGLPGAATRLVAVAFGDSAVVAPYFDCLGPGASADAFLAGLGMGVASFAGELEEALAASTRADLVAAFGSESAQEAAPLRAAVAVLVRGEPRLAVWGRNGSAAEAASAFEAAAVGAAGDGAFRTVLQRQLELAAAHGAAQAALFDPLAEAEAALAPALPDACEEEEEEEEERDEEEDAFLHVARQRLRSGSVPLTVISLWRSAARRGLLAAQLRRRGLDAHARWLSGVDSVAVSPAMLDRCLAEGAVLSQGEVGASLSHLTAWADLARRGEPFAVILEDDARLADNFTAAALRRGLGALLHSRGLDWDILALDYGAHDAVGAETTRPDVSQLCLDAARRIKRPPAALRLSLGCSHVSVGGYVLSQRGARALLANGPLPMREPVDDFLLRMVQDGVLDAFALLPPLAHVDGAGGSESVRRYFVKQHGDVLVTWRTHRAGPGRARDDDAAPGADSAPDCFTLPCRLAVH